MMHSKNQTDEVVRTILLPILALLFGSEKVYAQSTAVMKRLLTADGTSAT